MSSEEQHSEQEGREGSLYRRHRPRTFADVVGQEPVVRTLRNAVERGKVHHAYLFVGSRGTGKTSMAKILAACLNCEHGPTIEPCGQCDSCLSIARATSLDVIEMDAASNNSVDDIRELRESVAYAPVSGRRKVYILDEAHMLSTAAWNAFLKTLEEPPPNTVFVLATTEAAKVPATVVDRCHRFDFHRPTVEQIVSVLSRAAAAESIEIPPPRARRDRPLGDRQLPRRARHARAARHLLGHCDLARGRARRARRRRLAAAGRGDRRGRRGRHSGGARRARALRRAGPRRGLLRRRPRGAARELMIVQTLGEVPAELSLTPESDAALAEQAARIPHAVVVRLLELLGEALEAIRAGADARTRLELALVKAARPEVDSSLRALLARIERLESAGPPAGAVSAVAAQREIAAPPPPLGETPEQGPVAPERRDGPDGDAVPPAPPGPAASAAEPPAPRPAAGAPVTAAGARAAESRAVAEPPPAPQQPAAEPAAASLDSLRSLWPAVVDVVRAENALLGALIAEARPVEVQGEDLTLAFASTFLKKKAEDPANRMAVGEALRVVTGARWRLSYELREELAGESAAQAADGDSQERWLARFMEEFDAEEIPADQDGDGEPAVTSNEKGA